MECESPKVSRPSNFVVTMPDPLRIKRSGIQPHQAVVYEDFGKALRRIALIDVE